MLISIEWKWSQTQYKYILGLMARRSTIEWKMSFDVIRMCWMLWSLSSWELSHFEHTNGMTQYGCLLFINVNHDDKNWKNWLLVWLIKNLYLLYMHELFCVINNAQLFLIYSLLTMDIFRFVNFHAHNNIRSRAERNRWHL